MKLQKTDRSSGYTEIRIETEDDLWRLKDFIQKGDKVKALTQRTKLEGREKKTCKLKIRVEKTEFQENRLRVTGEIVEGAEDIELGYHTLNLEPEQSFELWKKLDEWQEKRSYKVVFALIEKGSADLYMVQETGIERLSGVEENIPGKMYADQKDEKSFFNELNNVLSRVEQKVDYIVLAGPGNYKRKAYNLLSDEVQEKTQLQDTSVTGETGLNEAIKRGALKKVVEDSRIAEEAEALEQLFDELREDGDASYGEPVEELVEQGAVEKLLITTEKNRENPELAKKVERQGGETVIVHTDHEAGERLESFGGIAALLRYKPS